MAKGEETQVVDFEAVRCAERRLIEEKRRARGVASPRHSAQQPANSDVTGDANHANDLLGLAFSGGGIRSATFNLGILQALAKLGLLHHVDYLSTVSGGGYLGGWFSALMRRYGSLNEVCGKVLIKGSSDAPPEPYPVRYLRGFSNYLTPKLGVLGLDVWTAVATYLRNLLLNWMILIPALLAALLVPYFLIGLAQWVNEPARVNVAVGGYWAALGIMGLLLFCVAWCVGRELAYLSYSKYCQDNSLYAPPPSDGGGHPSGSQPPAPHLKHFKLAGNGGFPLIFLQILLPLLLVVLATALLLRGSTGLWEPWQVLMLEKTYSTRAQAGFVAAITGVYALFWLIVRFSWCARFRFYCLFDRQPPTTGAGFYQKLHRSLFVLPYQHIAVAVFSVLASGILMGLGLFYLLRWFLGLSPVLGLVWGPPALLLWLFVLGTLHKGLARGLLYEQQREWFGRVSGFMLAVALAWVVAFGFSLFFPLVVYWLSATVSASALLAWVATTLATVVSGRSQNAAQPQSVWRTALMRAGPYVFVVGLVGILSVVAHEAALSWMQAFQDQPGLAADIRADMAVLPALWGNSSSAFRAYWNQYLVLVESLSGVGGMFALIALLCGVVAIFSRLVDVNDFSLQNFYANRLARAYLGASQDVCGRDKGEIVFTGFNHGDDMPLYWVERQGTDGHGQPGHDGPYHLINAALNLAATRELSWQERRAGSYVFSPLYCGYTLSVPTNEAAGDYRMISAYCPTASLRTHAYGDALTLGTAVATSGAAASPNMGFRTTAALAFLLTFFNVRLGRWISNPNRGLKYNLTSPRYAHLSLLKELFAHTTRQSEYIYVSDGGHFENLGVYELLRRRCRFIIACDAGQDKDYQYADLGNLIRKARADLCVDIKIDTRAICPQEDGLSLSHCATGTIHYPNNEVGYLLYIKPSLTGDEPVDILNYKKVNADFPHQRTADQFFSESQFESYRKLGRTIGHQVFERAVFDARASGDGKQYARAGGGDLTLNMDQLFSMLRAHWYPANPVDNGYFTRHTHTYRQMMGELRQDENLYFLLRQFYPEWRRLDNLQPLAGADAGLHDDISFVPTQNETQFRAGFTFCNGLLQLMEDIYLDLQLEIHYDHPDNRGWMNLFRHWSWSGMIRVTWAISASTFGQRFQLFCYRQLGMGVGDVQCEEVSVMRAGEADLFNFYEQKQIKHIVGWLQGTGRDEAAVQHAARYDDIHLFRLKLVTERYTGQEKHKLKQNDNILFEFSYGYAIFADNRIVAFRVQDHLRKMSLARRGLKCLLQQHYPQRQALAALRYVGHQSGNPFTALYGALKNEYDYNKLCLDRFNGLLNSVSREVSARAAQAEDKA